MKRPQRIHATLTVGKVTIPVRSPLMAKRLLEDQASLMALRDAYLKVDEECSKLRTSKDALLAHWWVRLGRKVRLLRIA